MVSAIRRHREADRHAATGGAGTAA